MNRPLRIVQVAPPFFEVPPDGYGGIETVIAMLVDGLVDRGHHVILIGAGRSRTAAEFRATFDQPQAERLGTPIVELTHAARVEAILADVDLDLVHDHSAAGLAMSRGRRAPVVITAHGPAEGEWREYLQSATGVAALVAISRSQTMLAPELPWQAVVHNALDTAKVPLVTEKADHLIWLGRMSPDKGAHLAIDLARQAEREIVLAAKCSEPAEHEYFETFVQPRLGEGVQWLGEVGEAEKYRLLGAAAALLFPLQWDEPFGMVLAEALACGTPVLTLNRGAVPEIVVDGTTGFIRTEPEQLVEAVELLDRIDPSACRARVEECFSPQLMVDRYERLFEGLVGK